MKDKTRCRFTDCFAYKDGHCQALKMAVRRNGKCPFYKTAADNDKGRRRSFYRVISDERFDLIDRYKKTLMEIGIYGLGIGRAKEDQKDLEQYHEKLCRKMGDELKNCPSCSRKACFAYAGGHCTALKEESGRSGEKGDCPFYKTAMDWRFSLQKSLQQLISREQFDLVLMYRDTLADIGAFADIGTSAKEIQAQLNDYRKKSLRVMREAAETGNIEACIRSLMPAEVQFGMLDDQPDIFEDDPEDDESTDSTDEAGGTGEPVETAEGPQEPEDETSTEETEPTAITTIPDDKRAADSQLKELSELVDDHSVDTAAAEKEIRMIYQAGIEGGNDDSVSADNVAQLHEENRLVKDNVSSVLGIEDFYRRFYKPGILLSQVQKSRSADDQVLGMLAGEVLLLTAKDYVKDLRSLWQEPEDIERQLRVLYYDGFIGSRTYWLFTNVSPDRMKKRCRYIALNREKAAILRDNKKIAALHAESD